MNKHFGFFIAIGLATATAACSGKDEDNVAKVYKSKDGKELNSAIVRINEERNAERSKMTYSEKRMEDINKMERVRARIRTKNGTATKEDELILSGKDNMTIDEMTEEVVILAKQRKGAVK